MKVFDLHRGHEIELPLPPQQIQPGRFRLLHPVRLNGCIDLAAGDLLWSDGGARCQLLTHGKERVTTGRFVEDSQDPSDRNLVNQAVAAVMAGRQGDQPFHEPLPSPVMPDQLLEMASMTQFERLLEATFNAGHLQAIAKRPRMDMRYDIQLMPVARVQRIATRAIVRLAAHSEDWHCRTLSGVQPARLLAQVSEDELTIYENVVFVRLLDRCHQLLENRVRDLSRLRATQQRAADLADPERLHQRLLRHFCELWGRALTRESQETDSIDATLITLKRLLHKVAQLRHSSLYQSIPRQRRVSLTLRTTNILQHDPNYCQLRPLWQEAHVGVVAQLTDPAEVLAAQARLYATYAEYVGLLIHHALLIVCTKPDAVTSDYRHGPAFIRVTRPGIGEWRLTRAGDDGAIDSFTFVASWKGCGDWSDTSIHRQVVHCHPAIEESGDALSDSGSGQDAVLNPLQFYAVERVRARIEQWLLSRLAKSYPLKVKGLSREAMLKLSTGAPWVFEAAGAEMVILPHSPLRYAELERLMASVMVSSALVSTALRTAVAMGRQLGTCRVCGAESTKRDLNADQRSFRWRCGECSIVATFSRSKVSQTLLYRFGDHAGSFESVGGLEAEVVVALAN